jgi:hypothetical protein
MAKKISEMSATERKAKREADRDRQQKLRDRKKSGDTAVPLEKQREILEARWVKNRAFLSQDEREKFDHRVAEATRIHNLMIRGSRLLRDGAEYGAEGLYIDLVFEQIELFARKYPPTDSVSFSDLLERGATTVADIADAEPSFQDYASLPLNPPFISRRSCPDR